MSEEITRNISDSDGFEERVLTRLESLEESVRSVVSGLQSVDARLQNLEARSFDTKPIWEQALKEIIETRRELSKRLDRIDAVAHETRADLRDAEDRIEKLETESVG